jgi:D-alanine-D-alanine ligase
MVSCETGVNNMKIVVLAGGLSPERDVSLSSGSLIANALMQSGHRVLLLDVYEGMAGDPDIEELFRDSTGTPYSFTVPEKEPDLEEIRRRNGNPASLIGPNVLKLCQAAQVVFIALHGAMGENGQLQATFDALGIKYTGTGYIGSLLAMDKDISKKLMRQCGIPTAEWIALRQEGGSCTSSLDLILQAIGLPCVVKPCGAGSSIGVSIVHHVKELQYALEVACKVEKNMLVEKMISGREFSVGILDGTALPVIEIIPKQGFYDYKNKYQSGASLEVCPAELTAAETQKVQELALRVHQELRLGAYSRIDFIMNSEGEFFCLEANTLPGMTPTSLFPQEARAAGIPYVELCNRIVHAALR